jgi:hypothetical protein
VSDESEFFHSRKYQPPDIVKPAPPTLVWYGDSPPTPPAYLIDETLPEIGVGILGGQFGSAKTFVGADLGAAAILGEGEFAGKAVKRKGGVLWLAAEGENEIEMRVRAAIAARGGDPDAKHPFARQAGSVPCLTDKDAPERLKALVAVAAERMRTDFQLELALIGIDTLSAAAGFDDENSAAETQRTMNVVAELARETKTLALLLDHYGKLVDTGVRGSSAKSAAADAILACLGDRDQATGATNNRRLAVAKLRAGPTGRVIPFRLEPTPDGLTCTVAWNTNDEAEPAPEGRQWTKGLRIFKRCLDEAMDSFGKMTTPRAGMPEVKAVEQRFVRDEFYRQYPAEAADAKRQAFLRCVKDAIERGVLYSLNVGPDLAQTIFWTL